MKQTFQNMNKVSKVKLCPALAVWMEKGPFPKQSKHALTTVRTEQRLRTDRETKSHTVIHFVLWVPSTNKPKYITLFWA